MAVGGAPAGEEVHLKQAHGVYVGVAEADGALEGGVGVEDGVLALEAQHQVDGALHFLTDAGEEFVSYLAGPDSDYMTGQAILIDGGMVFR